MGAAAIFARYALAGAGPLAVSAGRLAIAALILFALAAVRGPAVQRPSRGAELLLACAGLALAAHFAAWIASLDYTSVAISTLLVATTPLWTALYDALAHRRLLSRVAAGAFAAGAIGLFLVAGNERAAAPHPGSELFGATLALGGALAFAAYLLLVRASQAGLSTRTIVTRTYGWAALALVIAAVAARQPAPPIADGAAWAGILAMALISQLLGHTAINASLRWFSPSTISFANLLEPVFAALLALLIFHETLSWRAALGGAILLASVLAVMRDQSPILD